MDVKALKDKILQLAIQGKLVKQNINDEPASVLLERIKEEKEKLIKEKKIKKEKSLPEIKEEEKTFDSPNGWQWVRLGDLIDVTSGKNLTKSNMNEAGTIPVYGGNGITGFHDKFNVSKSTIVIGRVGFYCGSVHLTEQKAWVTDNAFITTYPTELINRNFLIILLKSINLRGEESSTAQPVISGKKIYPILVPLPPLEEQKRIVSKVDELFALIDELDNNKKDLLQNIVNSRNKILQLAIQGKLVEQKDDDEPVINLLNMVSKSGDINKIVDDEKVFDIPSRWEWVKLKDICEKFKYGSSAKSKESGDVPVLRMGNIQGGKIDWRNLVYTSDEAEINKYDLIEGDLLFNRTNSPELVGKTAIYKGEQKAIYAGYLIRIRVLEGINSEYINLFMNSLIAKHRCKAVKTDGVSQSNINAEKLGDFVISLPPIEEQKRIVEKVDMLISFLDELEESILA